MYLSYILHCDVHLESSRACHFSWTTITSRRQISVKMASGRVNKKVQQALVRRLDD